MSVGRFRLVDLAPSVAIVTLVGLSASHPWLSARVAMVAAALFLGASIAWRKYSHQVIPSREEEESEERGAHPSSPCRAEETERMERIQTPPEPEVRERVPAEVGILLGEVVRCNAILVEQLATVPMETQEAAEAILGQLREIDGLAQAAMDHVAEAVEAIDHLTSGHEGETVTTEDPLESIGHYVRRRSRQMQSDLGRVEAVVKKAEEMAGLTDLVREIALQINILSLNAAVEAVRAGDQGRGFAVVAQEMRKLALDSKRAAEQIATGIGHMVETIQHELADNLDEAHRREEEDELALIATRLGTLRDAYDGLKSVSATVLVEMKGCNGDLARRIMEAMGSIQFQDIVRQRVEQVTDTLRKMNLTAESVVSHLDDPEALGRLTATLRAEDLQSGYRMESQRAAHRRGTGETAGAGLRSGPAIELF